MFCCDVYTGEFTSVLVKTSRGMFGCIAAITAKHDRNQVLLVDECLNNLWYTHAVGYAFGGKEAELPN